MPFIPSDTTAYKPTVHNKVISRYLKESERPTLSPARQVSYKKAQIEITQFFRRS